MIKNFQNKKKSFENIIQRKGVIRGLLAFSKSLSPRPIAGMFSLLEEEIKTISSVRLPIKERIRAYKNGFTSDLYSLYNFENNYNFNDYLSEFARLAYTKEINKNSEVLNNKRKFYEYMDKKGFVHYLPELIDIIKNRKPQNNKNLEKIINEHRKVVIKPFRGGGGHNIYIIEKKKEFYYCVNGENKKIENISSLLDKTRNYIVTEYVNQSDFLNNIYPHSANTMRILVMNPEDSDPFIARSVLRIGTDRSGVFDNFSQGGLSVEINLKNGELSPAASRISPGNLKWYKKHPDTNTIIKGSTIPQWKNIKDNFLTLVNEFSELKYVGWDILLTGEGDFVIIEGNSNTDIDLMQIHSQLLKDERIRKFYLNNGIPNSWL